VVTSLPELRGDGLEYAYFSTSDRSLSGASGYGFTAVSPGLLSHLDWLALGTRDIVQFVKSATLTNEERQHYRPVGRKVLGAIAIAYRKVGISRTDSVGRSSLYMVEMRVGRRNDIPTSWLFARDEDWWTSPSAFHAGSDMAPPTSALQVAIPTVKATSWVSPSDRTVLEWISALAGGKPLSARECFLAPDVLVEVVAQALPSWCNGALEVWPSWEPSGPDSLITLTDSTSQERRNDETKEPADLRELRSALGVLPSGDGREEGRISAVAAARAGVGTGFADAWRRGAHPADVLEAMVENSLTLDPGTSEGRQMLEAMAIGDVFQVSDELLARVLPMQRDRLAAVVKECPDVDLMRLAASRGLRPEEIVLSGLRIPTFVRCLRVEGKRHRNESIVAALVSRDGARRGGVADRLLMDESIPTAWLFGELLPIALAQDPVSMGQLSIAHLNRLCEWDEFPAPYAHAIQLAWSQRSDQGILRRLARYVLGAK
jgi:hypothetical protein